MKNILITGGSRGIGADMVKLFSEKGHSVAFTYKNSEEKALCLANETNSLAICADNANEKEVLSAIEKANAFYGDVDVLINNAGISSFSLFTDITSDEWRHIFDVNVNGTFYFTKAVLPQMIHKKHGRIINISSMWGISGSSCEVHYSATKAALIGMTKALAKEVGLSGITVNCIAPGVVSTDMNSSLSEEDINSLADDTPLGRIGAPRDISNAAYFLASDEAAFITGQVMSVDGGFIV